MKYAVLIVVVFVGVAYAQKSDQDCNNDGDCGGQNWVCGENRKCRCGTSYREINGQCVPVLNSQCQASDECSNLPGSTCERNSCICKAGYLLGSRECNAIGKENDECTTTADCIHRIQPEDNKRECRENQCVCKAGFHFGDDRRCKNTRGFNDACELPDDCFQADTNNNNALQCVQIEDSKFCKCKNGYEEDGDRCNGTATLFMLSASSLLLFVATLLKL